MAQFKEDDIETPSCTDRMIENNVLRYVFHGYAVWLEVEQFPCTMASSDVGKYDDLEQAIQVASEELNVYPIPVPHLTALYGISHLSEVDVRQRFRDIAIELQSHEIPVMQPVSFLSDVEIEGLNGGAMDMAWIEATFKTSKQHEQLLDIIHQCFYKGTDRTRNAPWVPHVSLAYDNEDCPISKDYLDTLVQRFPTLAFPRKINYISLWDLNGTIDQWTLMDRVSVQPSTSSIVSDEGLT